MPRPKEFDPQTALRRAKDAFWARGYEATSMATLLRRMRISRGSFYATYRGKREVMLECLSLYGHENRRAIFESARGGRRAREAIVAVFRSMIDGTRGPQGKYGCLMVNCAMELAPRDARVASAVRQGFAEIEAFFADLVEQAKTEGDAHEYVDSASTARALLNHLVGLMVLVRSGADAGLLACVVEQADTLLGPRVWGEGSEVG